MSIGGISLVAACGGGFLFILAGHEGRLFSRDLSAAEDRAENRGNKEHYPKPWMAELCSGPDFQPDLRVVRSAGMHFGPSAMSSGFGYFPCKESNPAAGPDTGIN
ncbi:MAG TPA: hypothetical protein VFH85_04845 [Gammaproteobacteria bacterium]|nr:hypothetical protein [Gammaproteobacteria bacterium]